MKTDNDKNRIVEEIFCSPAFKSMLVKHLKDDFLGQNIYFTKNPDPNGLDFFTINATQEYTKKKYMFILKTPKNRPE